MVCRRRGSATAATVKNLKTGDLLMTIRKTISLYLMVAVWLALAPATAAQPSHHSGQTLEGAWLVTVNFPEELPFCAPARTAFTREGTVIAESCYASEGAGYGVWTRRKNKEFAVTFTGNSFGPDGTVVATYKVRATLTLAPDVNSFNGPFKTEFFDLDDNLLGEVTGTLSAARIPFEPLD
jgi:hypothetical protein